LTSGADCILSEVAERFVEAPAIPSVDVFVAVGSVDLVLPPHVIRPGTPGSVMGPAAGGKWFTFEMARAEVGV